MALPSASSFTVLDQSPAENFTEPASVPLSAAVTVAVSSRVESTASMCVGLAAVQDFVTLSTDSGTFTNAP